jgi:hypothetical protein
MKSFERPARYHIHAFWIAMSAWLETALERGLPIPEARYRPPLAG